MLPVDVQHAYDGSSTSRAADTNLQEVGVPHGQALEHELAAGVVLRTQVGNILDNNVKN